MEISVKELRKQPGRIISIVGSGNSVTVTMRGKPAAKIVPLDTRSENEDDNNDSFAFGMWKDRDDMKDPAAFVADLRKGRYL